MPCSPERDPPASTRNEHHLPGRFGDPLEHFGIPGIECDERVKVPVAGVKHVQHAEVIALRDFIDLFHHRDQVDPRHDRCRGGSSRVRPGPPRRTPTCGAFQSSARSASSPAWRNSVAWLFGGNLLDQPGLGGGRGGVTRHFGQENGGCVRRQIGVDEVLHGLHHGPVHDLERRWHDAGCDDPGDGRRGSLRSRRTR